MKSTIKLVCLMLVASAVIIIYALLPEKPVLFGDWGPKQIPLRRILINTVSQKKKVVDQNKEGNQVKRKKQNILFIGDSMVGLLCYPMSKYAEENGHTLNCVVWTSSSTGTWAKSDRLQTLVDNVQPTYVIICLGSNELLSKDMDGIESRVQTILKVIGNIPTVWIGPPNWCKDGGINNLLQEIMGKGAFFSSKDLVLDRQKDGRHPTHAAANKWMDAFANWMNSGNCDYPIMLKAPKGKKGKLDLTVIAPNGNPQVIHGKAAGHVTKKTTDNMNTENRTKPFEDETEVKEKPVQHKTETKDKSTQHKTEEKDKSAKHKTDAKDKDKSALHKTEAKDNSAKHKTEKKDNSAKHKTEKKDNSAKHKTEKKDNSEKKIKKSK